MSEFGSRPVQEYDFNALDRELRYAWSKWGGEFDDKNTINDWIAYATLYMGDAAKIENKDDQVTQYGFLLKAAGLLLTAAARVRQNRIAGRHYEGQEFPDHEHGAGRAFV